MENKRKLSHEEASNVYNNLFKEHGPMPSRPDILFSLEGEWKGWNDFLSVNEGEPGYEENKLEDERFTQEWAIILQYFQKLSA
jgi:hypothetical protein